MRRVEVVDRPSLAGVLGECADACASCAVLGFAAILVVVAALSACKHPSPASGPSVGSGSALSVADSAASCVPAQFAAIVECKTEGNCIGVYAVDAACVVTMRNELALGEAVTRIIDVAWPNGGGPLYVVAQRATKPVWAWSQIAAPLTAHAATVASAAWHAETFAQPDPDGTGFGIVTDGHDVMLTGCASWENDNEEEWHCDGEVYWSIVDQRLLPKLSLPAFATAWHAGKLGDNIVVRDADEATVECRIGGVVSTQPRYRTPVAVTVLAGDDYWLWYEAGGSRSSPRIGWDVRAWRGCSPHPDIVGQTALGPNGYWANRSNPYSRGDAAKWTIRQREIATPLVGQDGKPMLIDSDLLVWATAGVMRVRL